MKAADLLAELLERGRRAQVLVELLAGAITGELAAAGTWRQRQVLGRLARLHAQTRQLDLFVHEWHALQELLRQEDDARARGSAATGDAGGPRERERAGRDGPP